MFAQVGELTLHYRLDGPQHAPVVVLVNSIGNDLRSWASVGELLQKDFRVLRYDYRGQGLSSAPDGEYTLSQHAADLAGLLDFLKVENAAVVGVSLGGMIAQQFALDYPHKITHLGLCDTLPRIGTPQMWTERIAAVQEKGMAALAPALIQRWFEPSFFQEHPAEAAGFLNLLSRTPQQGYTGSCAALRDTDLTSRISEIHVPALVLAGESDVSTTPAACQALAEQLGAPFHVISQAAHLPQIEQPQQVADILRGFLQSETTSSRYDAGLRVRRRVLGDAHVDRATANATDFDRPFQQYITETAWGGPWTRGTLDIRERHLLTIAVLTALPREHELEMHIRATQNTGVTRDELREVFMHVGIYAGVPVANRAMQIAKKVLED